MVVQRRLLDEYLRSYRKTVTISRSRSAGTCRTIS
jgi:hypothetical protein